MGLGNLQVFKPLPWLEMQFNIQVEYPFVRHNYKSCKLWVPQIFKLLLGFSEPSLYFHADWPLLQDKDIVDTPLAEEVEQEFVQPTMVRLLILPS